MFNYLLARWRFKRAFKPAGEEFLYRKNSRAPAYRVSREERETFLRTFRRKYWKYHLTLMGAFLAALVAIIALIMFLFDDVPEEVGAALGYGFAAILLVAILLVDRRLYAQPLEALGNREPALPARSWRQANDDRMKSMSWPILIVMSLIIFAFAWLTFPQGDFEIWWPIIWALYFGVAGFNWGRAILRKLEATKAN
jgi:peptidoglycan/LPS O-acetylase OafA/YrhL